MEYGIAAFHNTRNSTNWVWISLGVFDVRIAALELLRWHQTVEIVFSSRNVEAFGIGFVQWDSPGAVLFCVYGKCI